MKILALSSVYPNFDKANILYIQFKKSLIGSFNHILESSEDVLERKILKSLEIKVLSLNTQCIFNSFVHTYNLLMIDAIKANDIHAFSKLVNYFIQEDFKVINKFDLYDKLQPHHQEFLKKIIYYECKSYPEFKNIDHDKVVIIQNTIEKAEEFIKNHLPKFYAEISLLCKQVIFYNAPYPKGGSSFDLFGLFYINIIAVDWSFLDAIDYVIHESSHFYLFLICCQDPLVEDSLTRRFKAPFRDDLRPMAGIYHATFVLARLILAFRELDQNNAFKGNDSLLLKQRLADNLIKFQQCIEIIDQHAKLTPLGQDILLSMKNCIL